MLIPDISGLALAAGQVTGISLKDINSSENYTKLPEPPLLMVTDGCMISAYLFGSLQIFKWAFLPGYCQIPSAFELKPEAHA